MLMTVAWTNPPGRSAEPVADASAIASWIEALCDNRWEVREDAAKNLRQAGPAALAALRRAVHSDCPETRQRSIHLIGLIEKEMAFNTMGHTLIADTYGGRVIEIDKHGKVRWQLKDLDNPVCVQRLENDRTLVAEREGGRVSIFDRDGKVLWQIKNLGHVWYAQRLDNGHTLITACGPMLFDRGKVIEVDENKKVVWEMDQLDAPRSCQRLPNGHTLIVERRMKRVIELNRRGKLVWKKSQLNAPLSAQRLDNGHTLITEWRPARVLEVDGEGKTVWSYSRGLQDVSHAERLANGHTLITDFGSSRVIQVNRRGNLIWQKQGLQSPCGAVRLTSPEQPPAEKDES